MEQRWCATDYKIESAHLLQLANEMDDIVDKHGIGMDIIPLTTKNRRDNTRLMVRTSQYYNIQRSNTRNLTQSLRQKI